MFDNDSKFMYILDLCNDLDIEYLESLIGNIECIIETKKEEQDFEEESDK